MKWKTILGLLALVAGSGFITGLIGNRVFGVAPDNSLYGWIHGGILFTTGIIFGVIVSFNFVHPKRTP